MNFNSDKRRKKYRSKPFDLHFPVYEDAPEYNALLDRHSSCYFKSKSVQKHLKQVIMILKKDKN